jgi:hypothetical protein
MGSLTATKKNKTANTGLEQARKIPPVVPVIYGVLREGIQWGHDLIGDRLTKRK